MSFLGMSRIQPRRLDAPLMSKPDLPMCCNITQRMAATALYQPHLSADQSLVCCALEAYSYHGLDPDVESRVLKWW